MNATKLIGIALIVISLAMGYIGYNKVTSSTKEVNLIGIKIVASDESGKQESYLYLVSAVVLFAGGIYSFKSKNS